MKYIIFKNQEKNRDDLLNDIAEFLWNSGHEVDIADNTQIPFENKKYRTDYDCHISIIENQDPSQCILNIHRSIFRKYCNSFKNAGSILIFSNTGVYTDEIPYPHKIFNYKNLDQKSLHYFFQWCRKINLFTKT